MHPYTVNIGHTYKAGVQALAPALAAEGSRNGAAVDVSQFGSGTLVVNLGAVAGAPSATAITYALQSSEDGATDWEALKDLDGVAQTLAFTAGAQAGELDFNLQLLPQEHRFLRVVETVDFTTGTSPTVAAGATFVLGGGQRLPI